MEIVVEQTEFNAIQKLSRDLAKAARVLSDREAMFLVDNYYVMQEGRKRCDNQIRAMSESGEPNDIVTWFAVQFRSLEGQMKNALNHYSTHHPDGGWLRGVCGIGPVLASGLLAHIDINKAPTVGHIWRFAGLDPTVTWEKGKKRPWNAALKVVCWKIGKSFVKVQNNDKDVYGKLYVVRKKMEVKRNDEGYNTELALRKVAKLGKSTENYKWCSGKMDGTPKLQPDHIDKRAMRYAVKQFLSDFHASLYRSHFHTEPPKPYPIAILGHGHHEKRASND